MEPTLYTFSTIALFGNIVTTLSEPAAALQQKTEFYQNQEGEFKTNGQNWTVGRPQLAQTHPELLFQQSLTLPLLSHHMPAPGDPAIHLNFKRVQ